ncbi:type II secretion system minor pseudopilin GspH [Shewanella surugensis]|uniref:Type II secretion system protein H n=1 Tax=Shewanella surugensis TaxID=212020 RepID=A0ABT0L8Y6_9GAMM|nr:type II secretion system minor pseudopilin GspH [Shewanella surugensis]MCL1124014.1 type II secretion system minor pseudopilin GspH [Shewanella surugensis]
MNMLRQKGFTLMEVLLVVLLMGLAAAAVTLSMSGAGKARALERTAQQFMQSVELVLDETVMSGDFVGIVVEKDHYKFVFYDEGKWKPLKNDRLLGEREMAPDVEMTLVVEGLPLVQDDEEDTSSWTDDGPFIEKTAEEKKKFPEPQIFLFPSGEMSAFELMFSGQDDSGNTIDVAVIGDAFGRMLLGRDIDGK